MAEQPIDRLHLLQIRSAYEAGFNKCAEMFGLIKPYMSLSEAYKRYGRTTVERWVDHKLITIIKDGDRTNSRCRIKRDEIELAASMSNYTG